MSESLTQRIDAALDGTTPGPWRWRGNTDTQSLWLGGRHPQHGGWTVMDFTRWGMRGAAPRFGDENWMMEHARELVVYEVARNQGLPGNTPRSHPKVYRADIVDIRHPDARLIAAAPTLLRECRDALAEKDKEIAALLAAVSTYEDGYRAGWDDASRGGAR